MSTHDRYNRFKVRGDRRRARRVISRTVDVMRNRRQEGLVGAEQVRTIFRIMRSRSMMTTLLGRV